MSTAGISFGGLASGLDTQSIIAALVAVERRPIAALQTKKTALNRQKTLFADLDGLLGDLTTAVRALKRTTDFLAMQATSDRDTVLTADAGSSATPGTHRVRVLSLATAEVRSSTGQADRGTTSYGDGTLQIDVGGETHFVSFGAGTGFDSTLDGIAQAIRDADIDVTAEVVDTGNTANSGASRYQLVVRSKVTGAAGDFALSVDSGTAALDALVAEIEAPANQRTAAADAHVLFNGIDVWRSSNAIADVIPGVTLNLRSVDAAADVTVTVSTDAEATAAKVQSFVDAYNKVVDFFTTQSKLDTEGNATSPLFGDVTLRSMRSSLRSIAGSSVETENPAYRLFSQVGIKSDTAGKLTFDRSKFEEALAADEQSVAAIFTNATNGIASRLETQIDLYTDSVDGLIEARNDGFDRLIKQTQSRIDKAERRLELYELQLQQRFANLESQLAQLQGQGNSLAGLPTFGARR